MRRGHDGRVATFAELYPMLQPDELLAGGGGPHMAPAWSLARSDSFSPAEPFKLAAE